MSRASLLAGLVAFLLSSQAPTHCGAQDPGWCLPGQAAPEDVPINPENAACTVEGFLVKISIPEDGVPGVVTCTVASDPTKNCDDLVPDYTENIKTIKDVTTCKEVCLAANIKEATPELCAAFTYIEGASQVPDLCYFLSTCILPDDAEDGDCVLGDDHCFSGQVCEGGEVGTPCKAPQDIDHDYTDPHNLHWSVPCLAENKSPDSNCNIYRNDGTCQHKTVCTLPKCGADPEVTHTCNDGEWKAKDGSVVTVEKWKEHPCNPCSELTITPEPGLSLFCLKAEEPNVDTHQVKEGPCNLYCDGNFVFTIFCNTETSQWTDTNGGSKPYYCWNNPDSKK